MSTRIDYLIHSAPSPDSATLFQATGTALTSSYVQAGEDMLVDGATTAFLHLYWTRGDETSIEVQARFALRSGGTFAKETVGISTNAAGTTVIEPAEYSFDTASDNLIIPIRIQGRYLRVLVKRTGGTDGGSGTYGMGLHIMRE